MRKLSEEGRRLLRQVLIEIDERLNVQLAAALADPELQELERTWRSLASLVEGVERSLLEGRRSGNARVRVAVRVLDVSATEVLRDITGAMSRERTKLYGHLYSRGLDRAAGEPLGLLLVGFELGAGSFANAIVGEVETREIVEYFAWLGSECLAPVVLGMSPSFLSFEDFGEIASVLPERLFHRRTARTTWLDRLRRSDESRFLVMAMPRVLLRGPYRPAHDVDNGFGFRHAPWRSALGRGNPSQRRLRDDRHLFGSAAFPLGVVIARSFAFSSWFTYVRGVECGDDWAPDGGGVFVGSAVEDFATDSAQVAVKPSVDVVFAERTEERLGWLGLTVLSGTSARGWSTFHSIPSFREIEGLAVSERLGAMTQYLLCACRVAHLAHRYAQTLVGSTVSARQIEAQLHDWLAVHQVDNPDTGSPLLLKRPLRGFKAEVRPDPDEGGRLLIDIWLQPHSQFSNSAANLHLVTSVADTSRRGLPLTGGRA